MTGNGRMLGALALAAGMAVSAVQAQAADMIGNCELFGAKGEFSITPAVAGQLTVGAVAEGEVDEAEDVQGGRVLWAGHRRR